MEKYRYWIDAVLTLLVTLLSELGDSKTQFVKKALKVLRIVLAALEFAWLLIDEIKISIQDRKFNICRLIIGLLIIAAMIMIVKGVIKGVKRMIKGKKYKIAFVFTEAQKDRVEGYCKSLIRKTQNSIKLSKDNIYFPSWHSIDSSGSDVATREQQIIKRDSELTVVVLDDKFATDPWVGGMQWKAINELIKEDREKQLFICSYGEINLNNFPGLRTERSKAYDITSKEDSEVADEIIKKYMPLHESAQRCKTVIRTGILVLFCALVLFLLLWMIFESKNGSVTDTTETTPSTTAITESNDEPHVRPSLESYSDVYKVLEYFYEEQIDKLEKIATEDNMNNGAIKAFTNFMEVYIKLHKMDLLEIVKGEPEEKEIANKIQYRWGLNTSESQYQKEIDDAGLVVIFDLSSKEVYIGFSNNFSRNGEGIVLYYNGNESKEAAFSSFGPGALDSSTVIYFKNGNHFYGFTNKNTLTLTQGVMKLVNKGLVIDGEEIFGTYDGLFSQGLFDDPDGNAKFTVDGDYTKRKKGDYIIGFFKEGIITAGRWYDKYDKFISEYPTPEGT